MCDAAKITKVWGRLFGVAGALSLLLFGACDQSSDPSQREESQALFDSALLPPSQLAFVFPGLSIEPSPEGEEPGEPQLIFGPEESPSLLDFAIKSAGRLNDVVLPQLVPVKQIFLNEQPIFSNDMTAVWFIPADQKGLERLLVAERDLSGYVNYSYMTRLEGAPSTDWRLEIYGSFTPSGQLPNGSGTIWVNLLKVDGTQNGRLLILWSRQDVERAVTLYHYDFRQEGADDSLPDASYDYWRKADGSGGLLFGFQPIDIDHGAPGREAMEQVKMEVLWSERGAGRLEAAVVGGDVEAGGYLRYKTTECWSAQPFIRTYLYLRGLKGQNQLTIFKNKGELGSCAYGAFGPIMLPAAIELVEEIPLPEEALNW